MTVIKTRTSYSLDNRPTQAIKMQKKTRIFATFVDEPFFVEMQEGPMLIAPDTVDDWDGGYYVVYPDDGSKPYAISPKFLYDNYEAVN